MKGSVFAKHLWAWFCCTGEGEQIPVWKKLAYGVGNLPYAMCSTVLGFYFNIFLLEVAIMDPVYVLITIFVGRVFDATSNPVAGYLISLTRTRFGRLRPWMFATMIPTSVTFFLVWYVPPLDDRPQYVKFIYYLIIYLLLRSLLSCLDIAYLSLSMHITNDNKERDSVVFFRVCFEQLGTVCGMFIFTLFYLRFVQLSSGTSCDNGNRIPDSGIRSTYRWQALTIGLLIIVCTLITIVSVKEQEEEVKKYKKVGFIEGIKETLGFKPFVYLLMVNVLSWLAFQFLQGNAALYLKYSVGMNKDYPYVLALLLVSIILFAFFWQYIIVKFGKKTALYAGLLCTFIPLLLFLFINFYPPIAYLQVVLLAVGGASVVLVPWSMLPDVIDEAALKTGVRREELFYSFSEFGNKMAGAISLAVSLAALKIAGYNELKCEHPWPVALTLKLLMTVPPFIAILLTFIFLHYYPITEKSRAITKQLLAQRRAEDLDEKSGEDMKLSALPSTAPSTATDKKPLLETNEKSSEQ